ncbi:MAG: hypothetical protein ACI4QE_04155, partial [Acutalibacteraceae bacterium]
MTLLMSVLSLVLIISLLTVGTYSWMENRTVDTANNGNITLSVDPGLNATWGENKKGSIEISNFELREVSSVDGRNVYVPDDSFFNTSNTSSGGTNVTTDELRFREAVPADVYNGVSGAYSDTRYVALDVNISSPSETKVFLSANSIISGLGKDFIRVSIDPNDGSAPLVFSQNANTGMNVMCKAVKEIDSSDGKATATATQTACSFSDYTFVANKPIFTLKAGEVKKVTVTIWLEGTSNIGEMGNSTISSSYDFGDFPDTITEDDLSVNLIFTTEKDYTNTIYVYDRTLGSWLGAENNAVFVFDASTYDENKSCVENSYWQLNKVEDKDNLWVVNLPQNVTKIIIQRFNLQEALGESSKAVYNAWGWTGEYALEIPGAQDLRDNGSEVQRKNGITRTYNILGNYSYNIAGLQSYQAGLWGEFNDSNFDTIYLFDQSMPDGYADVRGYFNKNTRTPFVSMKVSYSAYGESFNVDLTYQMYLNYVQTRLYRMVVPVDGTGISALEGETVLTSSNISEQYFYPVSIYNSDSTITTNFDTAVSSSLHTGSDMLFSSMGSNRYYSFLTGSDGKPTTGYWGTRLIYYNNKKDINDNAVVRYSIYLHGTGTSQWISLAKWNDKYSGEGADVNGTSISDYAFVIPGDKDVSTTKLIYCRMNKSTTNNAWNWGTDIYNQTADNHYIDTSTH